MHRGFSLVEILITISIIGILSSIVLTNLTDSRERAKIAKAQLELRGIRNAVLLLSSDTQLWPGGLALDLVGCGASNNEIGDLSTDEAGIVGNDGTFDPNWNGPYMESIPVDPWGRNYFFDTDYQIEDTSWTAVLGSLGPNGGAINDYDSDNIITILASSTCP